MQKLLDSIRSPDDVKALTEDQLPVLAREIRERLVQTVAATGGHLASNLGVVELTIALHRVLQTPRDKIVWDVGHQAYVHKLLTGRAERFHTLRQRGGISGFANPRESRHDAWGAGHGSTAVSAAMGLALARDLAGTDETIAAIVGDGALTGGAAFEGLNNAGRLKENLVVILNDNEYSISRNVGALANYLGHFRTDPHYLRAKENFEEMLHRFPAGELVLEAVRKFKGGIKQLFIPGMLFEDLGFTYLGPVDGHDITALVQTLLHAKQVKGPVLIHVITKKGNGYPPAEQDVSRFHGTSPYKVETGEALTPAQHTYSKIFGDALVALAEQDKRIVAITAAMCDGTGLADFAQRFPERFFDVGMAEQHAVLLAGSLASAGLRPVAAIYSTFLQRAFDQILHDVCLQNLPVVFAIDRAGIVGEDGPTHHGNFDLSYLRLIPNIVVMAPRDLTELVAMLRTGLSLDMPAAIRYPRGRDGNPPEGLPEAIPLGRSELMRDGDDVAFIAVGSMVAPCMDAAEILQGQGVSAAVLDARFVKPLDEGAILSLAERVGRVITVEENAVRGGFGSAVLELLAERGMQNVQVRCAGIPDAYIEHGARKDLLESVGLCPASLASSALSLTHHGGTGFHPAGWRVENAVGPDVSG
jgi:1-deoxy-D-xylulose-5-phosphate synthase